mgnify:CR=1 FL=1
MFVLLKKRIAVDTLGEEIRRIAENLAAQPANWSKDAFRHVMMLLKNQTLLRQSCLYTSPSVFLHILIQR